MLKSDRSLSRLARAYALTWLALSMVAVTGCGLKETPSGGGTGSGSAPATVYKQFLYVTNFGDNNVSVFSINETDGQLTSVSTRATSTGPKGLSVHPNGTFLFVANSGSPGISRFSINKNTGDLTSLGMDTPTSGGNPTSLVIDPAGKFLYAAISGGGSNTAVFSIGTDGSLTLQSSKPGSPLQLVMHPSGTSIFITNTSSLSVYQLNSTSGAIGAATTLSSLACGENAAINPEGTFFYIPDYGGNQLQVIKWDGVSLTSSTSLTTTSPGGVTVNPSLSVAYVLNYGGPSISKYAVITTDGTLAGAATVASGGQPWSGRFDYSGAHLYVVGQSSGITTFDVDATTGALTNPHSVATGTTTYQAATIRIAQ